MRVILSGGGTGGHVYPALAVATALRQELAEREPLEVLYIGVRGRMDDVIVAREGLPFRAVRAGALRVGSFWGTARGLANLAVGAWQALRIVKQFRPDAVFATGGYASVPVGVAARLCRRPLIVYLPDVRPGWAVRLLARLATRIATTAEASLRELPRGKAIAVGYPIREEFWSARCDNARRCLSLDPEAKVLLVSGASQGAHALNQAVADHLDELLAACEVVHLTGRAEEPRLAALRQALPEERRRRYHVYGYLHEMPQAMAAADLAVMRSGASVLGELPATGLPAILVPGVYEGWDQSPNARFMEEESAAVMLPNNQLHRLPGLVQELLSDEARLESMREAAQRLARPEAARCIAQLLMGAAA
ncbi:MAG: UDP-N-acetylglucosamine--N-acetylmuramyl-(pentapeptide) pyrophosphoryl-undecaprenol N-acetylglucosamine transferase [Dehalococcoidia bacterium]